MIIQIVNVHVMVNIHSTDAHEFSSVSRKLTKSWWCSSQFRANNWSTITTTFHWRIITITMHCSNITITIIINRSRVLAKLISASRSSRRRWTSHNVMGVSVVIPINAWCVKASLGTAFNWQACQVRPSSRQKDQHPIRLRIFKGRSKVEVNFSPETGFLTLTYIQTWNMGTRAAFRW